MTLLKQRPRSSVKAMTTTNQKDQSACASLRIGKKVMRAGAPLLFFGLFLLIVCPGPSWAQLTDRTLAPNNAQAGIAKSLEQETGAGRGDPDTLDSSLFIIQRDPFRSIRRGRQLFQRKFRRVNG